MTERHVLMSAKFGAVVGHLYLARRNAKPSDSKSDNDWTRNYLSDTMEAAAASCGQRWMPVLVATELDAETARDVQALLRKRLNAEQGVPLTAFRAKKKPLFIACWLMENSDPECVRLMDLH